MENTTAISQSITSHGFPIFSSHFSVPFPTNNTNTAAATQNVIDPLFDDEYILLTPDSLLNKAPASTIAAKNSEKKEISKPVEEEAAAAATPSKKVDILNLLEQSALKQRHRTTPTEQNGSNKIDQDFKIVKVQNTFAHSEPLAVPKQQHQASDSTLPPVASFSSSSLPNERSLFLSQDNSPPSNSKGPSISATVSSNSNSRFAGLSSPSPKALPLPHFFSNSSSSSSSQQLVALGSSFSDTSNKKDLTVEDLEMPLKAQPLFSVPSSENNRDSRSSSTPPLRLNDQFANGSSNAQNGAFFPNNKTKKNRGNLSKSGSNFASSFYNGTNGNNNNNNSNTRVSPPKRTPNRANTFNNGISNVQNTNKTTTSPPRQFIAKQSFNNNMPKQQQQQQRQQKNESSPNPAAAPSAAANNFQNNGNVVENNNHLSDLSQHLKFILRIPSVSVLQN